MYKIFSTDGEAWMSIFLINQSKQPVIYSIDGSSEYLLPPLGSAAVAVEQQLTLLLKHTYKSKYAKKWFTDQFVLVLESEYRFQNFTEGDRIYITREKICFHYGVWYDHFFTNCPTAQLMTEKHFVSSSDYILKRFKAIRRRDFGISILLFPFYLETSFLGLWLFLSLLFWIGISDDGVSFGTFFKYYIPISLVVFLLKHLICILFDKTMGMLFKSLFEKKSKTQKPYGYLDMLQEDNIKESRSKKRKKKLFQKREMPMYLNNDFILSYYANPDRIPYSYEDFEVL